MTAKVSLLDFLDSVQWKCLRVQTRETEHAGAIIADILNEKRPNTHAFIEWKDLVENFRQENLWLDPKQVLICEVQEIHEDDSDVLRSLMAWLVESESSKVILIGPSSPLLQHNLAVLGTNVIYMKLRSGNKRPLAAAEQSNVAKKKRREEEDPMKINVELLTKDKEADASLNDNKGWLPIHVAAYAGNAALVETLLQEDSSLALKKTDEGFEPLVLAVRNGRIEVIETIVREVVIPSIEELKKNYKDEALEKAVAKRREEVKIRLKARVVRNKALAIALKCNAAISAPSVFEKNTNKNLNHVEIVRLLCKARYSTEDFNNCSLFFEAIKKKSVTFLETLLKQYPSIHKSRDYGFPGLVQAVNGDSVEIVKLLLRVGADTEESAWSGWTPLRCCCTTVNVTIAETLLEAGANVDTQCKGKETPLFHVCNYEREPLVRLLLRYGAKVDVKCGESGKTALMIAKERKNHDIVEILEEHIRKNNSTVKLENLHACKRN